MKVKELDPRVVWEFFDDITRIPRPSKHEERIMAWLEQFAEERGLEYERDSVGNLVIRKPASAGYESSQGVILQSHVDMVAEKNSDVEFDFLKDPIQTYVEDGWVKARGTTLGADCGIGVAAALAVLASDIPHGPLEALFTVDEETGLTGAFGLGENLLRGNYLINLDSEEEGEIFIGCAGGIDTVARIKYVEEPLPVGYAGCKISVRGLKGGHSGDDIHRGLANSNKLITRFLRGFAKLADVRLGWVDGGNLHNAIPREAYARFAVPAENVVELDEYFASFVAAVTEEFRHVEDKMEFKMEGNEMESVIDKVTQTKLLGALQGVPNGVLAMSHTIEGLVDTSTNLASVKFVDDNIIKVVTSQRSSSESSKYDAMDSVESVFQLAGAAITHSDGYPGWTPDPDSELLAVTKRSYESLFGKEPRIRAIHAGLECGLFLKKYPHLQMVSFGPTLRGVHSPDERMEIKTVDKFWELLKRVLAEIK